MGESKIIRVLGQNIFGFQIPSGILLTNIKWKFSKRVFQLNLLLIKTNDTQFGLVAN